MIGKSEQEATDGLFLFHLFLTCFWEQVYLKDSAAQCGIVELKCPKRSPVPQLMCIFDIYNSVAFQVTVSNVLTFNQ